MSSLFRAIRSSTLYQHEKGVQWVYLIPRTEWPHHNMSFSLCRPNLYILNPQVPYLHIWHAVRRSAWWRRLVRPAQQIGEVGETTSRLLNRKGVCRIRIRNVEDGGMSQEHDGAGWRNKTQMRQDKSLRDLDGVCLKMVGRNGVVFTNFLSRTWLY